MAKDGNTLNRRRRFQNSCFCIFLVLEHESDDERLRPACVRQARNGLVAQAFDADVAELRLAEVAAVRRPRLEKIYRIDKMGQGGELLEHVSGFRRRSCTEHGQHILYAST